MPNHVTLIGFQPFTSERETTPMTMQQLVPWRPAVRAIGCGFAFMLLMQNAPAQQVTADTLLDRIQIEDFLTRYYYDLSEGKAHDLSEYFTEDAVGRAEIEALYGGPQSEPEDADRIPTYPRGQMLLTNPVIEVNGDTAQAHVIWTGVMNPGVGKAPSLTEQGREDTELVKRDGKWLIKRRYISSDSGLPDRFDETYEPRSNPLDD
jgi:hypothetical protein